MGVKKIYDRIEKSQLFPMEGVEVIGRPHHLDGITFCVKGEDGVAMVIVDTNVQHGAEFPEEPKVTPEYRKRIEGQFLMELLAHPELSDTYVDFWLVQLVQTRPDKAAVRIHKGFMREV